MRQIPKRFTRFTADYPAVAEAYRALSEGAANAGPLDDKTRALVKLGIAIGARNEGATHSQTRKALDLGLTPEEVRHAAILSVTTIGFPNMMAGLSWVEHVLDGEGEARG